MGAAEQGFRDLSSSSRWRLSASLKAPMPQCTACVEAIWGVIWQNYFNARMYFRICRGQAEALHLFSHASARAGCLKSFTHDDATLEASARLLTARQDDGRAIFHEISTASPSAYSLQWRRCFEGVSLACARPRRVAAWRDIAWRFRFSSA